LALAKSSTISSSAAALQMPPRSIWKTIIEDRDKLHDQEASEARLAAYASWQRAEQKLEEKIKAIPTLEVA
jgi:hypothetical protein